MSVKFLAGVGACALAVPAIAWAQGNGAGDAGNWAAIAQCGAIKNADRRHECVDGVLQRAGVLSGEQRTQEVREEFGRQDRPVPRPAPVERSQAVQPVAAPTRPAELDEVVTTIAATRSIGYQRVRVTTAEGAVWDQTQGESFPVEPRKGDRFSVDRGSMNSFLCQFGRSSRYRCERTD
jgi:hypothetical protein